jgi:DNA-binding winged helix-turn-helix (wHTH) protein/tetratricopeptide (TPR) repeat protein
VVGCPVTNLSRHDGLARPMTSSISFGDFKVTPESYELRRGGEAVHLEPRVFEVLVYLLRNADRVVPKEELLRELWDGAFVSDSALSRAIRDLRRALGDTGAEKRWIETVYGRGFRFKGATTTAAISGVPELELIERDAELETLAALLAEAGGEGRLALVMGEAGIGKTTLLEAFVRTSAAHACWGSSDALFTPRPLGAVQDLATGLGGELPGLIADAAPREAIFGATLAALEAATKPCVLVLEDLHWADEATLDWLKFVARRLPRLPGILLLASYRDDEVVGGHPLRTVLGELPSKVTRRLALDPLSPHAVERLASTAGRSGSELWEVTGGNPFFVTEALSTGAGSVPATVRDAVVARASRLSAAARAVLDAASVIPNRVDRSLLAALADPPSVAVTECLDCGMLRIAVDDLSFRHELARLALQEELPPDRRRELHRLAFRALVTRSDGSDPARLVHHAAEAGERTEVLRLAPLAAEQAAALGAHREAAAHCRTALAHAEDSAPEERADLLERLSYECYLTDQLDEALETRQHAVEIWRALDRPAKLGDGQRWLSRLLWFVGRNEEARARGEEAIETLEAVGGRELAMAYSNRAQLHMLSQETRRAVLLGGKAIELAEQHGDAEIVAHALNNVGSAQVLLSDDGGWAKLEESLSRALAGRFHEHVARAYTNLGSLAVQCRDYRRARPHLEEGIAYCLDRDLDSWVDYMQAWKARLDLDLGQWEEAAAGAAGLLDRAGVAAVSRVPALAALGAVRVRRGDPGATEILDQAWELALGTGELQRIEPVARARAEAAWWRGDRARLADELAPVLDLALRHPHPWELGEIALWMWRAGGLTEAPAGVAEPYALEMAGDWRSAGAAWEAIGCPYEAALARGAGDEEMSLREALACCESLGAAPAVDWIRARLA